jgi:hypothetical protein
MGGCTSIAWRSGINIQQISSGEGLPLRLEFPVSIEAAGAEAIQ